MDLTPYQMQKQVAERASGLFLKSEGVQVF